MRKLILLAILSLFVFSVIAQDDELNLPEAQTVEVDGININYYETEGEGADIFFVHGNSSSAKQFAKQLEMMGDEYHIVAIDLTGHGLSTHVEDEEMAANVYTLQGYAATVVQVAEALDMTEGVFVGASLGGHILLEAVDELPDAAGFVIYGTPPIGLPPAEDAWLPSPAMAYTFAPELTEEDIATWIPETFAPGYDGIPDFAAEDMAGTDGNARAFLGLGFMAGTYQDEVEIVGTMEAPLAIFQGEQETVTNLDYMNTLDMPTLWRGEIQIIADAGHYAQWENPEDFNELLKEFIDDVTDMD